MAAFLISEIEIHNPEGYEEYRRLVLPTLDKYGGRFIARGGKIDPFDVKVLASDNSMRLDRWIHTRPPFIL